MIFTPLKKASIQKFYNIEIRKQKKNLNKQNKIKTVAILIDEGAEKELDLKDISKKLNVDIGFISVFVFQFNSKLKRIIADYNSFTEKDFGRKGSLKSNNLKEFVKKEYDVLINYSSQSNLYVNVLTLLSQAKFKMGFTNVDDRLFDLIVTDHLGSISVFNKEIHKYLTILKKIQCINL